ncbi:MAG: hypothetical protein WBE13_07210 [Candidatus Acidiferrum sp.]
MPRRQKTKRGSHPVQPAQSHSAAIEAALAGQNDFYTVTLLALEASAARVGIEVDTQFLTLEDKVAAIMRSLEQCREWRGERFAAFGKLLAERILATHRAQTELADVRGSEHAQEWKN